MYSIWRCTLIYRPFSYPFRSLDIVCTSILYMGLSFSLQNRLKPVQAKNKGLQKSFT